MPRARAFDERLRAPLTKPSRSHACSCSREVGPRYSARHHSESKSTGLFVLRRDAQEGGAAARARKRRVKFGRTCERRAAQAQPHQSQYMDVVQKKGTPAREAHSLKTPG